MKIAPQTRVTVHWPNGQFRTGVVKREAFNRGVETHYLVAVDALNGRGVPMDMTIPAQYLLIEPSADKMPCENDQQEA